MKLVDVVALLRDFVRLVKIAEKVEFKEELPYLNSISWIWWN